MTETSSLHDPRCPVCGTPLPSPAPATCPACGMPTASNAASPADPYGPPAGTAADVDRPTADHPFAAPKGLPQAQPMFSSGTLALQIAVGVAVLWAGAMDRYFGFMVLVVTLPALLRTLYAGSKEASTVAFADLVVTFVLSLLLTIVLEIAMLIAFVATCFPMGLLTNSFNNVGALYTSIVAGLLAAGLVAWTLGRRIFRLKGRPSS
ncbi:MAG: hypothetical protein U0835_18380 [Isosphaeraceae bacterium]